MKTITPNQRFKHDRETYEEGQEYEVEDGLAYYFEMVGWVGPRVPGQDVTLEIHDSEHGHVTEVTD